MKLRIISLLTLLSPAITLAADSTDPAGKLVENLSKLIGNLIPIAFAAALLFFFYGLAIFILKAGGEDQAKGKSIMLWGVIALFIMASITGIISFLGKSIGINNAGGGGSFNPIGVKGVSEKK